MAVQKGKKMAEGVETGDAANADEEDASQRETCTSECKADLLQQEDMRMMAREHTSYGGDSTQQFVDEHKSYGGDSTQQFDERQGRTGSVGVCCKKDADDVPGGWEFMYFG